MRSERTIMWIYCACSGLMVLLPSVLANAQEDNTHRAATHTASPLKSAERSEWKLKESNHAIQRMRTVLGVGKDVDLDLHVGLTLLEDANTPYLKDQVIGRPLWKTTLRGWKLQLPSSLRGVKDDHDRVFDVWIEPVDGRLVRVESRWPDGEPPMAPEPSAESATDQMLGAGPETYHGFPDAPPKTTFVQALDGLQQGGAAPLAARQIIAEYVLWSGYNIKYLIPRPVWAITLRGEPPLLPPPGSTTEPRFQNRYIVDATTGVFLCASNIPVPEYAKRAEKKGTLPRDNSGDDDR